MTTGERLLELLERWREGEEQGRPATVEQLCADCPELAETLREHIALIRGLEGVAHADGSETIVPPAGGSTPAGERWRPAPERPPPVPGYADLVWLGGGGMGRVYRALDTRLGRTVALKLVRSDQLTPAMLDRLRAEARAVAGLDHPHIVKVFEVGQCRGDDGPSMPFIALEYVPGGSLEARLAGRSLPPDEAARLVRLLASAVAHAHERGIVHRDLKPDNVLLAEPADVPALNTPLGSPKVTDFGLARRLGADVRLTARGMLLGTPAYMAPEQVEERSDVGPPADVYALGVILYRLLGGRPPFESASVGEVLYRTCHETPPPLRGVPGELERICLDCLEKDPVRRPTAAQLARRLETWGQTPSPRRRRAVLAAVLALAVLLPLAGLAAGVRLRPAIPDVPPAGDDVEQPLRVRALLVQHFHRVDGTPQPRGTIGQDSMAVAHGDAVTLTVELSELAYCYLIGFNFDGKEQLLWPSDEKGWGEPGRPPPRLAQLRYPRGGIYLDLDDDEPRGGLQAFVVAASRQPLPAYAAWKKQRGAVGWKWTPGEGVWEADPDGTYAVFAGTAKRGTPREAPGTPPLAALCRALRRGGVEAVEAFAFPVRAKEGRR